MNAQLKTTELATVKPGTKRALVFDYLTSRVEATMTEIVTALHKNPIFTQEAKTCKREISETIRHMINCGLVETDHASPAHFWVSKPGAPSNDDQIQDATKMVDPEPTPTETLTPDNFTEVVTEILIEAAAEITPAAETIPALPLEEIQAQQEANRLPIPGSVNRLEEWQTDIRHLKHQLNGNIPLIADVEGMPLGIVKFTHTVYETYDEHQFSDLEEAKKHIQRIKKWKIYEQFLDDHINDLRLKGPFIERIIFVWEKKRETYLAQLKKS